MATENSKTIHITDQLPFSAVVLERTVITELTDRSLFTTVIGEDLFVVFAFLDLFFSLGHNKKKSIEVTSQVQSQML